MEDTISRCSAIDALLKAVNADGAYGYVDAKTATDVLNSLPSVQSKQSGDFEQQIHAMFDHIWDCEIDHPMFQDTVGDLMTAVIQCFNNMFAALLEQRWIPCNERLPEYWEPVLTWDGHYYAVEKRIPYIFDDVGGYIEGDWWVSDWFDDTQSDYYPNLRDGAAIEWMPLPEAFSEDDTENE